MFRDVPDDPSLADPLPASPFPILGRWLDDARSQRVQRNPWAMAVATTDGAGRPSLRVVLCRGYEPDPGYVVFYTNRESRKGLELAASPNAAASFHWDSLQRQVRLEGPVTLSPDAESDAYFAGRPRPSQVAAWASAQSRPIESREELLEELARTDARFGGPDGPPVPRPPHWGGYRLHVERAELWVGSEGRAHDRALWERTLEPAGEGFRACDWRVSRLQP
ncbi:MAG: pyridoxamine 5'-phosphate oxidase [Myxococcota bacterium]|nr:pyridoxamine 5'-phosphate oxidase [Myxococcota bacterium]